MNFVVGEIRVTKGGEQYEILEIKSSKISTGGIVVRFIDSGVIRVTDSKSVRAGSLCSKKKNTISPGDVFGRLTVIERITPVGERNVKWRCKCDCGNISFPVSASLTSGKSKSCGCYRDEIAGTHCTTHGMSRTREHNIWCSMKQRCYDPNKDNYQWYGARGIKVCDEWKNSFEKFFEDMGPCPDTLTLERKDPNADYCKDNCKWDTMNVQGYNTNIRSNNVTGRTGVYKNKKTGKWTAAIGANGKIVHLGTFETYDQAVSAREEAELKYYGFNKK